jgi:hypothetical protein
MKNKKWSGFLINLFGVILGISLTFGGNSIWQKREENKKTKEMLILIRNELEDNKNWFKYQEELIRKDSYVYKKIIEAKGDWSTIPIDTLNEYRTKMITISFSQLTTFAWQIFQNSEIIQKMSDKELVIRLAGCYYWIDKIHEIIMTEYWNDKKKTDTFERDPYKYFDAVMLNKESIYFYEAMSSDDKSGFKNLFFMIDTYIDYTISLLDKSGYYRYDMKEKDNEFGAFIEARKDSVDHKTDSIQKNDVKSENQ